MDATAVPMRERLTRENLHGVWAAIATPFDQDDRFDEDVFRENLRRLHAAGVHGIYTTDSDGEFYAIELDEFKRIVDVFADETQRLGIPAQVGVTWCSTQGMIDRLRYAAARGILGAHVGHPFFMPMTPRSYHAFWRDMQGAVPDWFALVLCWPFNSSVRQIGKYRRTYELNGQHRPCARFFSRSRIAVITSCLTLSQARLSITASRHLALSLSIPGLSKRIAEARMATGASTAVPNAEGASRVRGDHRHDQPAAAH